MAIVSLFISSFNTKKVNTDQRNHKLITETQKQKEYGTSSGPGRCERQARGQAFAELESVGDGQHASVGLRSLPHVRLGHLRVARERLEAADGELPHLVILLQHVAHCPEDEFDVFRLREAVRGVLAQVDAHFRRLQLCGQLDGHLVGHARVLHSVQQRHWGRDGDGVALQQTVLGQVIDERFRDDVLVPLS